MPEPLIDLSDSSSTSISKKIPKLPETNEDVEEIFVEPFDSDRDISSVTTVNKYHTPNLPIDISKPQETPNVTVMIEQAPGVRDYSF